MIYKKVKGSVLKPGDAQQYGERIAALIDESGGSIVAQEIVDDAKHKRSPLHDFFEWNDKDAAARHRLEQARYLLRSIQVVVKDNGNEIITRAFHNVTVDDSYTKEPTRVNVTVQRVMSDEELHRQVIEEALQHLRAWRRKYKQYSEFAGVFSAIEEMQEKLEL